MIWGDFHTHTDFSDGANTPEEMVLAAIEKGMPAIGISDHSFVPFDLECGMKPEQIHAYQAEIRRLKAKYAQQIGVLLGIEQDFFTEIPADGYDYVIGSVHYVAAGDSHVVVDSTPESLRTGIEQSFGGDAYALAERYWEHVSQIVERTNCDIIGHLDLIQKFNRGGAFFDEAHPRYQQAAKAAIDRLLETGKPFEINTGALSRGYGVQYPSDALIAYIQSKGGKFLLSSDSHRVQTLCYGFAELAPLASMLLPVAQQ